MSTITINNIPIRQLREGTSIDETTTTHTESWSHTGSYLSNKEGVSEKYNFKCGVYDEARATALAHMINGNFHAFTYYNGLESGTGIKPLSSYQHTLTPNGVTIGDKLTYKLSYDHCHVMLYAHGDDYYEYDSLTDTLTSFGTDIIISYKHGILTISGTGTLEFMTVFPMSNVPSLITGYFSREALKNAPYLTVANPSSNLDGLYLGVASTSKVLREDRYILTVEIQRINPKYLKGL